MSKITVVVEKPKPPERKIVIELSVMEAAHLGAFLMAGNVGFYARHLYDKVYYPLYKVMVPIAQENGCGNELGPRNPWHGVAYDSMEPKQVQA